MTPNELQLAWNEMETIFAEAISDWETKRKDYQDAFMELGAKGQFSEIWRKVKKLQRAVWDGEQLHGESPEQIAKEIIPHCVMMVFLIRREL